MKTIGNILKRLFFVSFAAFIVSALLAAPGCRPIDGESHYSSIAEYEEEVVAGQEYQKKTIYKISSVAALGSWIIASAVFLLSLVLTIGQMTFWHLRQMSRGQLAVLAFVLLSVAFTALVSLPSVGDISSRTDLPEGYAWRIFFPPASVFLGVMLLVFMCRKHEEFPEDKKVFVVLNP
jgi:hypothetical protein